MIKVENLTKTFSVLKKNPGFSGALKALFKREHQIKEALKGVTLNVQAGEMIGLIGANGAGKTTLVKILAGIIHPTSGTASVLGYNPWERKNVFRKQIGLLMGQKAQLWWDLPASDCFRLLKEIYAIPDVQFNSMKNELCERLRVTDLMQTPVRRLSLGERMKMELIAVLLHQPKVVFLDEPTLGLDITAQKAIRQFLKEYSSSYKPAILITSHYMQDIEELCKRVVIIREGSFVYDGLLSGVRDKYAQGKKVSFQLKASSIDLTSKENILSKLNSFTFQSLNYEDGIITVKVDRLLVASLVNLVMNSFDIQDVTIEEDDIADVIEALMLEQVPNVA